jgi:EAL domain-containing protein (putative c-di-GMP-specific phosphodiesterase class I)
MTPPQASSGLSRYMPACIALALATGFAEAIAGIALHEPSLLGSAGLVLVFVVGLVAVGRLHDLGKGRWEAPLLAVNVYGLGILGAILIPGTTDSGAMLPILGMVLLIPDRSRRGVVVVMIAALVGSAVTVLMGDLPHPFPPLPEPLMSIFASATLLGVAALILGALTLLALQAQESLDRLRGALRSHEATFAERAVILASLGRLERRDTIKATAELIVDALRKLPDIDLAGVFASEDGDLEVLAMNGPAGFPMRQGDHLPADRAHYLLARMGEGPWAERWATSPGFGAYGAGISAVGVQGQAFAPFYDEGVIVGVVAIGTISRARVDHLIDELPAVAEFAATASLLLAPLLAARRDTAIARLTIEGIMEAASYRPVFQPIVELATGKTVGFEALTRFVDARRPDLVFAAAAQAGLGLELEVCTLEAAILAGHDLPGGAWLSLNVSPSLVIEGTLLPRVLAARDRPVVLEITEHVAIDDYRAVRSAIDRLGPGIRVAVDDAGAGIANFTHLVELRPRLVKVDAGLIRDLDTDLARQAVVVGLVHFAATVGCVVIAEGIETEAERATAQTLGVSLGQGFLMARPARVGSFVEVAPPPLRRGIRRLRADPASPRM